MTHVCLNCHGSGWYDTRRQWGCFRCGGMQYPSKKGTGIDPISNALCILESVLFSWVPVNEVVPRTVTFTKWSRDRVKDYLNWMYTQGLITIMDDMAIDTAVFNSLMDLDDESAFGPDQEG